MDVLAWMALFSPAVAVVAIGLLGDRIGRYTAGLIAAGATLVSFICTLAIFFDLLGREPEERSEVTTIWTWLTAGDLRFGATLLIDPLSVLMMLVVSGVGFLILVYAIGYMRGDEEERRYHAYKALFIFSMLLLVMAGNLLLLLAGWGMVGLSSYLLINYWHRRHEAVAAGKKAFVMNAVGDATFVLALFILVEQIGSLDFATVFAQAPEALGDGSTLAVLVALGLLGGALAKSAQVPLHTWLPDAMEGPTPVSALIHAATMVTAGVYLIARTSPLFELAIDVQDLAGILGAVTLLLAGLIALVQTDIKRVIAYSTMSQIGYMFVAVGLGRLRRRDVPPDDARLLQGAALHGGRRRHPRPLRRAGHPPDGRPRTRAALDVPGVPHRFAGAGGDPAVRRLLLQGRHPLERRQLGLARLDPLDDRDRRRVPHRPLHLPAPLHRLLRGDHALRARAPAQGALRGPALDDVARRRARRPLDDRRLPPGPGRAGRSSTRGSIPWWSPSRRRAARSPSSRSSPR